MDLVLIEYSFETCYSECLNYIQYIYIQYIYIYEVILRELYLSYRGFLKKKTKHLGLGETDHQPLKFGTAMFFIVAEWMATQKKMPKFVKSHGNSGKWLFDILGLLQSLIDSVLFGITGPENKASSEKWEWVMSWDFTMGPPWFLGVSMLLNLLGRFKLSNPLKD